MISHDKSLKVDQINSFVKLFEVKFMNLHVSWDLERSIMNETDLLFWSKQVDKIDRLKGTLEVAIINLETQIIRKSKQLFKHSQVESHLAPYLFVLSEQSFFKYWLFWNIKSDIPIFSDMILP